MKIKNILFDLDGTIIEPKEGIINSILYALDKMQIKEPNIGNLNKFIGPPLIDSFKEYYGLDNQMANKAVEYFRGYFSKKGIKENSLYENVDFLLNDMHRKKINLFIATSKPTVFAKQIVKAYKLDNVFQQIIGSNLDNTRANKDEIIHYALNENQLIKSETIMIGDRNFDIIGANKNGIESIGVTYGHGTEKELKDSGADYIIHTVRELNELLQKKT